MWALRVDAGFTGEVNINKFGMGLSRGKETGWDS